MIYILSQILFSCKTDDKQFIDTAVQENIDVDGDGYPAPEDCDDNNSEIHINAVEICDGEDNDCDEEVMKE